MNVTMAAENTNLFRCDLCPMTFITDSGVRRHLLCVHGHRFHRGRASSPVSPALLDAAVSRVRMAQTNSRTRRRIRALRQDPPSVESAECELDTFVNDILSDWPNEDVPVLAHPVQHVVLREVGTQHEVQWGDVGTETEPPPRRFNAMSQAIPPALRGTALLVTPAQQRRVAALSVSRPDLPPDRLTEWMRTSTPELEHLERELMESVVGVACRAVRTFARHILAEFRRSSEASEDRRAGFLAAHAMLEEAADRSTGAE